MLEDVVRMWLAGDWKGLIAWAKQHGAVYPFHDWDDPLEYEYAGDYETDARHTYPNRDELLRFCFTLCMR